MTKKTVSILYATAGGGHKSAAMALKEAFDARPELNVDCRLVDTLKEYAPAPLDLVPEAYGQMIKQPKLLWTPIYKISDGPRRTKFFTQAISAFARRGADRLVEEHRSNAFISVYHLANAPVFDALERRGWRTPFVTVVTDLVTTPPVWFDTRARLHIVPTVAAQDRALAYGIPADRVQVIGLPISSRFSQPMPDKAAVRAKLGWDASRLTASACGSCRASACSRKRASSGRSSRTGRCRRCPRHLALPAPGSIRRPPRSPQRCLLARADAV